MENAKFAVVDFVDEKTDDGYVVELVPMTWMSFHQGRWGCYYPRAASDTIRKWVEDEKPVNEKWKLHLNIEVLAWADDHETGIRRLERSYYRRTNLVSEDSGGEKTSSVRPLSRAKARELLRESSLSPVGEESNVDSSDSGSDYVARKNTTKKNSHKSKKKDSPMEKVESQTELIDDGIGDAQSSQRIEKNPTPSGNSQQPSTSQQATENSSIATGENSEEQGSKTSTLPPSDEDLYASGKLEKMSLTNLHTLSMEATLKAMQLKNRISDPILKEFVAYVDARFDAFEKIILWRLEYNKRSTSYDFQKSMKKIDVTVAAGIQSTGSKEDSPRNVLGVDLPLTTLDDFLELEKMLDPLRADKKTALEKQQALKALYRGAVLKITDYKKCVNNMIGLVISVEVQKQYSGQGRVTKISSKKNYSATIAFKCMEEIMLEKFPSEANTVATAASTYLSNVNSRKASATVAA